MPRTPPDFAVLLEAMALADTDFVLIGGLAMVAHGSDHYTTDIDFAIRRDRENAQRVATALAPYHPRPENFPSELPYPWDAQTVLRATILTLLTDKGSLDLLGETPGVESYEALQSRASVLDLFGYAVKVASVEDLIRMKRAANRAKDQGHILELETLQRLTNESSD